MQDNMVVVCHFYNEEYLLPAWLKHHKKIFTHGIMIDYQSTDSSSALVAELCPSWKLVKSINDSFDARLVDLEVEKYEAEVEGWVIALNVTEFLIGDTSILSMTNKSRLFVPAISLLAFDFNKNTSSKFDLDEAIENCSSSINFWNEPYFRPSRCLHKDRFEYSPGRHFNKINQSSLIIVHVANYLMDINMVSRRVQIGERVPISDKIKGYGVHHCDLDLQKLQRIHFDFMRIASNPGNIIRNYMTISKGSNIGRFFDKRLLYYFRTKILYLRFYIIKLLF